jgi:hypothetical protein
MATVLVGDSKAPNLGPGNSSSSTSSADYGSITHGGLEKDQIKVAVSDDAPPLGAATDEKRFWFQRARAYDPNAIATLVSYTLIHSTIHI